MSRTSILLTVSAGLAGGYLALTAWMSAHGVAAWASSGAAGFCGFGTVAVMAFLGSGCCREDRLVAEPAPRSGRTA